MELLVDKLLCGAVSQNPDNTEHGRGPVNPEKVPYKIACNECLFYIGLATIMVSVVYVFNHYGANTARMPLRFSF